MTKKIYVVIRPRGLNNEIRVYEARSREQAERAVEIIDNGGTSATASIVSGNHWTVKAANRDAQWGYGPIPTLCEDDVAEFRPELIRPDGSFGLGGGPSIDRT